MTDEMVIEVELDPNPLPVLEFDSKIHGQVDDGIHIKSACIGGRNWSMRNLYTQEDVRENEELAEAIAWELVRRDIVRGFAPTAGMMSGIAVHQDALSDRIALKYDTELWRKKDLPSCAVPLQPGDAFVGSFGGCGMGIITGDGVCIALHIGRDGALDRSDVCGFGPSRTHFSVVDAAVAMAVELGADPSNLTFRCLYPLPQDVFGHPRRGEHANDGYNLFMGNYIRAQYGEGIAHVEDDTVYLDMYGLPVAQARKHGLTIDHGGRRTALPAKGRKFGHTRNSVGSMKMRRNLVIVHRLP